MVYLPVEKDRICRTNGLTFMRNRGELAEGWYDPATLRKAQASLESTPQTAAPWSSRHREAKDECSDEDAVGPALPHEYNATHKVGKRSGPTIPNLQDLEFKRGVLTLLQCYCSHL